MPAYRSDDEGEIRQAVVEHLRLIRPKARIIHEINCSTYGPNRIDVMAVSPAEIISVEIKSKKDKLDRLPAQIVSMRACSHYVFAALHEKFLERLGHAGNDMGVTTPDAARGAIVWVFPRIDRKGHVECKAEWIDRDRWAKRAVCLPSGAINLLWREELIAICARLGMRTSKLTMPEAVDAITWRLNGEQLALAICTALRARRCVEADPEILENAA